MFHQKNRYYYTQIWNLWVLSYHVKCSTFDPTFQQDWHLHWQDCSHGVHVSPAMVRCTCYHMPIGLYNIVMEHGMGTQRFRSNLCSRFNLVSFPLGCTLVLGLELGTRLWFVDWVMDEIVPLSLPLMRLWLLFWPLPCAVTFTLCLTSSFDTNSATSFCSMLLPSFTSSAFGAINFQFQNNNGFIVFQTEGKSQCLLKISAGFFLPAMWWILMMPAATAYRTRW